MKKSLNQGVVGIAMVMPSFLILLVLVVYPVILSVIESFTGETGEFSLEHYTYLFTEPFMVRKI